MKSEKSISQMEKLTPVQLGQKWKSTWLSAEATTLDNGVFCVQWESAPSLGFSF
jgi:hypothetical protein